MRVQNWGGLALAACTSKWVVLGAQAVTNDLFLSNLRVRNPPTADMSPYFSWICSSSGPDPIQVSYHILVSRHQAGASDAWDSGIVLWKKPHLVKYTGLPLSPHTRYFWSLQIETTTGTVDASANFTTGFSTRSSPLTIQGRQDDSLTESFLAAEWIWTTETDTPPDAPPGDREFRRTYTPPSGLSATAADILITVDNFYDFYVAGQLVGSTASSTNDDEWQTSQRYHVSLFPGSIVFAVLGINAADPDTGVDTPAGMLIAIMITLSDGSTASITSDGNWLTNKVIYSDFQSQSFDDSGWPGPFLLGDYGISPWYSEVNVELSATTVSISAPPSTASSSKSSTTTSAHTSTSTVSSPTSLGSQTSSSLDSSSSSSSTSSSSSSSPSSVPSSTAEATDSNVSGTTAGNTLASTGSSSAGPAETNLAASSPSQGSSASSASNFTGPIVGGVIGGIVLLAVLVFVILCRKRLSARRRRSPSSAHFADYNDEVAELSSDHLLIEPFTQTVAGLNNSHPPESVGKSAQRQQALEPEYYQDRDHAGGSSGTGSSSESPGGASERLQRLETLMVELNREIKTNGEGTPYVSELRGRIAELTREGSSGVSGGGMPRHLTIPPPYQYQSEP